MRALRFALPLRFFTCLVLCAVLVGGCELFDNRDETDTGGPVQRFDLPAPTGPYAVGTTTMHLVDTRREETYTLTPNDPRELMVQLWYPTDTAPQTPAPYMDPEVIDLLTAIQDYTTPDSMRAFLSALRTNSRPGAPLSAAQATYPVVLFSHGLPSVRALHTTVMEELASHGYVVVGVDHTYGSLGTVFPDGRVVVVTQNQPPLEQVVTIWANDLAFVLDELTRLDAADPDGRFTGRLDLDHVAAAGQSFGGSAAAEVLVFDRRFTAGISLDAPQLGAATTQGITDPFLLLFANPSEYFDTAVQEHLRGRGYSVTVDQTTHYSFTDLPILIDLAGISPARAAASNRPPGTLSPARNREILNAFLEAFLDRHLRNQSSVLLDGDTQAFPEVTLEILGDFSPAAAE